MGVCLGKGGGGEKADLQRGAGKRPPSPRLPHRRSLSPGPAAKDSWSHQAAKSQVCDPGPDTPGCCSCDLYIISGGLRPFPSQTHLDGKRQDAPCQLPHSADSRVPLRSRGHEHSPGGEMRVRGRQGENRAPSVFIPILRHTCISREPAQTSRSPRPLSASCLPLL